jgi:hypothetical protein
MSEPPVDWQENIPEGKLIIIRSLALPFSRGLARFITLHFGLGSWRDGLIEV